MGKITPLFGSKAGEPGAAREPVESDLIEDVAAHLVAAKGRIADSRNEERRLAQQAEIAARAAGEWEQHAMAAVRAGDDVVAKDALLRKRQHELEFERLRSAEKTQHQQTASFVRAVVALSFRVEESKQERRALVTRAVRTDAAPALQQEAETPAKLDAGEMLKRLEAKMTAIESELELSDEAIANLAREAGELLASKPLAKTVPDSAESARSAASQAVGVSGPKRTKR